MDQDYKNKHEYHPKEVEGKWQQWWTANNLYKVAEDPSKPKYYVLDMFPYPSGSGLHVGHPLGYIASDIYSRYKRLKGFNVLHPMGYDAFGLPAEQYAIQTGQHPKITTTENIQRYREQLDQIGFSFDWSREIKTADPEYYRWTQWIFIQLFNAWYNPIKDKAEPIQELISIFETNGFEGSHYLMLTGDIEPNVQPFTAQDWINFTDKQRADILMNFRLAYLAESYVNWCPALGTVLANDEVKDGVSERGGHPVERKLMMQWSLRITMYAERLLVGLDTIDWSDSLKEAQRNWIGKSVGASVNFQLDQGEGHIEVFTTRPDTLFGVTYLTLAPEHELVTRITTAEQKGEVEAYVTFAKNRSERERMADVKHITGAFTGAFAKHPFTQELIPVWIGDYVLAGYGTGAVMAVPAHDSRDFAFAKHFSLPLKVVIASSEPHNYSEGAYDEKSGVLENSDFLNGLSVKDAIATAIQQLESIGLGEGKINYRLRDAIFGRQRYWGEPIPVYYKDGVAHTLPENELPLLLPEIDKYLPTETGEPPLARAENWKYQGMYEYELSTMPGWAGSSWYFLRYMDPHQQEGFASAEAIQYWKQVDLYMGGSEHATGHLLYVRFWTKFLFDLGLIPFDEPAKKLINQGMIQGMSAYAKTILIHLAKGAEQHNYYTNIFISSSVNIEYSHASDNFILDLIKRNSKQEMLLDLISQAELEGGKITFMFPPRHQRVDVNYLQGTSLDIKKFREWKVFPELKDSEFIAENWRFMPSDQLDLSFNFIVDLEVEKMSKSKWNVITPDTLIEQYGADTLRLYEMFLGPLEQSKPWSTQGIEGVFRFLKKLWKLFVDADGNSLATHEVPTKAELKALHKTIKKVGDDIENFSFNTSVSSFMICVNELTELKCHKHDILKDLLLIMSPYAPHITEELWHRLGEKGSILEATFPVFDPNHLVEDTFSYPVSINGKHRTNIEFNLNATQPDVEAAVLLDPIVQKWLEGKAPKKIVFVKGKIINLVL